MRETIGAIRSDAPLELDDTCTWALAEIDAALVDPYLDT
jgi:hypothetical protein